MTTTVKAFIICLLHISFCQLLYAQASPKADISKKQALSLGHNVNRSNDKLQVSLLQGAWSDDSENNAIFYIEGKHVKFFDHIGDDTPEYQQVYWHILNKKLSFHYSGGTVVTDDIIKLTKDSLVLHRKGVGFSRYVRLK